MKKILLIPIEVVGVIDVRQVEYYIIDNIQYLQQISAFLVKSGKRVNDFKFCQFEREAIIPFFFRVKNRLSQEIAEFELERVRFADVPASEEIKKTLIEEIYLKPLDTQMRELIYKTTYWIATERLGDDVDENEFINLKLEKDELESRIKSFDYRKYLNEIA